MVQAREQFRLALEPPTPLTIFEDLFRQPLQRHHPINARVLRPVDLSHPARTERREDLVGAETSADADGHEADGILSAGKGRQRDGGRFKRREASHESSPDSEDETVRPAPPDLQGPVIPDHRALSHQPGRPGGPFKPLGNHFGERRRSYSTAVSPPRATSDPEDSRAEPLLRGRLLGKGRLLEPRSPSGQNSRLRARIEKETEGVTL